VLSWLDIARDCFADEYGSLERGFLTRVFGLVIGLQRVFHLDQMQDVGFALLTGDSQRCPSRYEVGAWRRHVRFCRGPLQMMGWLAALVYNTCEDLAEQFSPSYAGKFIGTLRRTFFNRPGNIYSTPNTLIVYMDAFNEQEGLVDYIDQFNASEHRIPWHGNRKLVLSLSPPDTRAGP
jgi:hypothetical protein